jgi:hypothetical protein
MRCHVEMSDASPVVAQHEETIEQPERGRGHDEEIDGGQTIGVVGEEGTPGRRRRPRGMHPVLGHGGLGNVAAQQPQFRLNARRAPQGILPAQAADEPAEFGINARPARTASRLPAPPQSEALAMPADDSGRADDHQTVLPSGPASGQADPEQAVPRP